MRAYELMIIFRGDFAEDEVEDSLGRFTSALESLGARLATVNRWGKRRFAYEIDHRSEGYYVVVEFVSAPQDFAAFERSLRLADVVVRHKLIRLPDSEADRRGLWEPATETDPAGA